MAATIKYRTESGGVGAGPTWAHIVQVPDGSRILIHNYVINNTTGSTANVGVAAVPSHPADPVTPATEDYILQPIPVDDDDPFFGGGFVLNSGDALVVTSDVSGIHAVFFGEQIL